MTSAPAAQRSAPDPLHGSSQQTPAPLSRFVGRRDAMADIERHFARGSRLITLWGPGGMGKTRLAIEHARARERAGDQVIFVALAEAPDLAAAAALVARASGLHAGDVGRESLDLVGRALAARGPLLLVLDNLEHLLPAIARPVAAWLERAPSARLLATSRERTRLPGETALELHPLALPDEHAGDEDASASEAVELFLSRVVEQRHGGDHARIRARDVAPLVRALEGIPFAIELAAARFDVLGVEGLTRRLSGLRADPGEARTTARRLDLLGPPRRGGDARTSTLRGAIEWSWSLLVDEERVALARTSVFPATFSLDAATHVLRGLHAPALDLVESLRDRSMLRLLPEERGLGASRFDLYEAVRELAAEKLSQMPGEALLANRLHAEHYLEYGESLAARFAERGDVTALQAIALELPHFAAIVARAPTSIEAVRALVAIDPVVTARGGAAEHAARLDRALSATEQRSLPPRLLGRALGARGRAHMLRGEPDLATRDLERALSLAIAGEDRSLEAELFADLGVLAHRRGDLDRARGLYERALAVDRASGGSRTEGRVLGNLGAVHHDMRRADEAIAHYEAALAILATNGDHRLLGIVSTNLGTLEQEQGAMRSAKHRFEQGARLLEAVGDVRLLGITLTNLGLLHHEEGRLEAARFCHEQALQKLVIAGDRRSEGLAFVRLGAALASLDLLDEARAALHRGPRAAAESGSPDALVTGAAELATGFVDLTLARRARDEGRERTAAASLERAIGRARRARAEIADRSDDARALLRILERGISALGGGGHAAPRGEDSSSPLAVPARALLIAPEARWMKTPDGSWRDLRRRGLARRLLLKLVERQREAPGAGVSLDELREAGWPGERMSAASAANRLYVALHQMRALGLEAHLVHTDAGYLLDPTVPVYHVAIEPSAPAATEPGAARKQEKKPRRADRA